MSLTERDRRVLREECAQWECAGCGAEWWTAEPPTIEEPSDAVSRARWIEAGRPPLHAALLCEDCGAVCVRVFATGGDR